MSPPDHDELRTEAARITERNTYGDALHYELVYQRHLKHLEKLDAERAQYQRLVQDAAYDRNLHLRINKLPVEVLSLIFHRMREPRSSKKPSHIENYPFKQKTRKWVVVTWVCRHWRNIALNDPTLWTVIPRYWSLWTPEFIARAGNAGLRVDLRHAPMVVKTAALMQEHSRHISHLKLSTRNIRFIYRYFAIGGTPKLQSLSVEKEKEHYREDSLPQNDTLPTNIFIDCEALRYLELARLHIHLPPSLVNSPSIFHGSIRQLRLSQCTFQKIEDFKLALSGITSLESLLLHRTLSRHPVAHSDAPFPLRCVYNLDLDEDPAHIIWFYNNFFTRQEHLSTRLTTHLEPQSSKDLLPFLTTLARSEVLGTSVSRAYCAIFEMKHNLRSPDYRNRLAGLALRTSLSSKTLSAKGAVGDIARFDIDNGYDVTIHFAQKDAPIEIRNGPSHETFHSMFATIHTHFQWNNLHELALVNLHDVRSSFSPTEFGQTLRKTFGKLLNLRVVLVNTTTALALINALCIDTRQSWHRPGDQDPSRKEVAFPGLQELYLELVCIDCDHERERGNPCIWRVKANRLLRCLQGRLEHGVQIQRLVFSACTIAVGDHLDAFKQLVPKVEWDKYGLVSDSDEDSGDDEEDESDGVPTEQVLTDETDEDDDDEW